MWIGRVIGTLVATPKDDSLTGSKLLIVLPTDFSEGYRKGPVVALDTVGAGTGEKVLVTEGGAARNVHGKERSAADAAIIGIIDTMEIQEW